MFPWPISQHMAERCHAGKSLCRVFSRNLAVFASVLDSIASIVVGSVPQWWFRWVGATHNTLYSPNIPPPNTKQEIGANEYSALPSRLMIRLHHDFCVRIIVTYSFFITRHDTMQKNFFFCVFEATIHRSFCTFRRSSALIRTAPNCLLLNHSNDIQTSRNH